MRNLQMWKMNDLDMNVWYECCELQFEKCDKLEYNWVDVARNIEKC